MASSRSLPAPTTAMSFFSQYLMESSRPLSPMSPAWLLAMVTTLMPLSAMAGARSGLPLMTTSFQPCASPPVVSGLSRFTKPKSLFSNVGAMLLKRSLPMPATTPLTPNPPMTSPPAVTEKVGAAVGVGLGDGLGEGSAAGEVDGAGDAATLAAGPACSAVASPPPNGPQPAAAATPAAPATMMPSTMRKTRPPPRRLRRRPPPPAVARRAAAAGRRVHGPGVRAPSRRGRRCTACRVGAACSCAT